MKSLSFVLRSPLLVLLLLFTACNNVEPEVISNGIISLQLWSDWKYKSYQGIDSIEGVFKDENEEINFSYGFFGSNDLSSIVPTPETLYYEETMIDGRQAKITKTDIGGVIYLFLNVSDNIGDDRVQLSVLDPDNDQKFITIFKSLLFL